ncbi:MAG TPA: PQQ-binding-like beta-propeller repeat protein [Candidatus Thermoplasmatota archaeon]|nr:PQQ-binding-like beta-propeller repeat protein [Candidatus Thermoplasmatota archaeon]
MDIDPRGAPLRSPPTLAVALVAVLLAGGVVADGWPQPSHDAARTSAGPEGGPVTDDVAWISYVPGTRADPPLVVGGSAYVLTQEGIPGREEEAVFRVDLDSGAVSRLVSLESPDTFVLDEERVFVQGDASIDAYALADGSPVWTWAPRMNAELLNLDCAYLAVRNATLYGFCGAFENDVGIAPFVVAIDAATGTERWVWQRDVRAESGLGQVPEAPTGIATRVIGTNSMSVIGPYVLALTREAYDASDVLLLDEERGVAYEQYYVWALNEEDGTLLWSRNTAPHAFVEGAGPTRDLGAGFIFPAAPTGSSGVAFLRLTDLVAVNPATGEELWNQPIGAEDAQQDTAGGGFAFSGDALYVPTSQSIYRFDPETHAELWRYTLPPEAGEVWGSGSPLMYANGTIYARSLNVGPAVVNIVYALDAETGRIRWRHEFPLGAQPVGPLIDFSVGGGLLLAAGVDGNVTAFGRTSASLAPQVVVSDTYPAPGALARADLSGTGPGLGGPASAYRAEWGDGNVTGWQASPVLEHAYATRGDRAARLSARNDAGQTSSVFVTFHVGATPPVELTFLQRAFSQENQNATFFILGLVATTAGGLATLARLQRRRRRLEDELRAIDETYARTKARPMECEVALAQHKARARTLLLERRLEEVQCTVLERHVEELMRTLRMHEIEELLDHLPRGLARAMEEMLADGRITAWERRSFLAVLEDDRILAPESKVRVLALIEAWYARDNATPSRAIVPEPAASHTERTV